jgi:hypothetical protein
MLEVVIALVLERLTFCGTTYHTFPFFTTRDMANAYIKFYWKDNLGIKKNCHRYGRKYGWAAILEWVQLNLNLDVIVPFLVTNAKHSPLGHCV